MDKRHPRGLSKQAVCDSCFGSLVVICFSVSDGEIKRAGGRASSPSSRPPAVENPRSFFGGGAGGPPPPRPRPAGYDAAGCFGGGGGAGHAKVLPLDFGFKIRFNLVSK